MILIDDFDAECDVISIDSTAELDEKGTLMIANGNNYAFVKYKGKLSETELDNPRIIDGVLCVYPAGTTWIDKALRDAVQTIAADPDKDNDERLREISELLGWNDTLSAYSGAMINEDGSKTGYLPDGTEITFPADKIEEWDGKLSDYYTRYNMAMRRL